ncbi:MAG: SDR family oxidoreductase [Alphaproteobacteria bacterium]|nr:SDR family oxidoreductase [Alphaproteobacteria bacterium]
MSGKSKRLFCFGYGYVCDYLGYDLQQQGGWTLSGTTRDEERRNELLARRIRTHIFDNDHPLTDPVSALRDVTHVLVAAPPDRNGAPAFNMHADDILKMPNLEWFGYLSTTGVYGDRNGHAVDESSELNPTNARGEKRARAEQQWLSLFKSHGLPVHIFRLSGIYGPGRSALDSVRVGVARRIDKPGHKFNRIHVDDIVQAILASFEKPNPGSAYNLADDLPAPSHEVIGYACDLLGLETPPLIPFNEADLAPMALSFYKDNKVVLNNKIKEELGVALKYPDFKSGLQGCLEAEKYAEEQEKSA